MERLGHILPSRISQFIHSWIDMISIIIRYDTQETDKAIN